MSIILVTGADGFLGTRFIELLKNRNLDFIGVSRRKANDNYIHCDLSNASDVINMLDKTQAKTIVNLASSVDFKEAKSKYFFPVNVLLPAIIANYCESKKLHFIHPSGTIVHGFSHTIYNKYTKLIPNSGYGKSKLLGDNLIMGSDCKNSILRFGGIFGKNGPQHLGINKTISNSFNGVIPSVVGSGKAKRNYIYVKDAAEVILKCIDKNITGINYVGGEIKTINDMLNDICEVFKLGHKPKYIDGQNVANQVVENSINFNITPFKTALKQMV